MTTVKDELRACVDAFVNEVSDLVRQATVAEIVEALKNVERQAPVRRAGARTETASASARLESGVASRKPARPATAGLATPKAGQKRTPELLAQQLGGVHSYIKAHPGRGVAPIAASVGTSTREISLLLRKLLDQKAITSKGKKRGTRYYPK